MSVLTKVFVVLLTVFSIALSMLVVAAFARQEDWKTSSDHYYEAFLASDAERKTLRGQLAVEQQRALDRHREDVSKINELKDARIADKTRITELELRVAEAENSLTVEQGQVSSVSNQNQLLQGALNSEKEFSAKRAKRNSELERRNIDLNDRVKELTSEMTMAASQIRALKQQIVAMGEETGGRRATIAQIPGGPGVVEALTPTAKAPAIPLPGMEIRGEVKRVQGNLASISVGDADGVAPGMIFLIYRRSKDGGKPLYLGSLRVTKVEAAESAGLIEQSVGEIKPGDLARDELSFAMRS